MAENCTSLNSFHMGDREEMSSYKKDAVSVVCFRIVYNEDDLNEKSLTHTFKPDMAHQVFGESESIFGYRSLSVTLNYLHNSSNCYVDVQSSGHIDSKLYRPDDVMQSMNSWLPENYTTDKEGFVKILANEKHDLIFGTLLSEFQDKEQCKLFPKDKVYSTYKITLCDIEDENFKDFHRRFETFIVWFIDAANFIDLDDERWLIFYVYEEFEHPKTKKIYRSPVGFSSVYKFYAYPNNIRARISQFFVLPSHQKRGIGSKLYQTIAKNIKDMPEVIDITVEEPTSTFQKIRDFDDCLIIHKALEDSKMNLTTTRLKEVFELMRKQKICKRQSQRIYDILGCCNAWKNSPNAYQKYIDKIKNRIASNIERETRDSKRLCNSERVEMAMEHTDINALIEAEFKRYIDDLNPSIKYLQQHLN